MIAAASSTTATNIGNGSSHGSKGNTTEAAAAAAVQAVLEWVGSAAASLCPSASTVIVLFVLVVVVGGLKSWLLGKIVSARPHTRPPPPSPIEPCMLLSATKLSAAFEAGTLTSLHVTDCYIAHIERINPYLNAVVYTLYDEARVQAAHADKLWAAWRKNPRVVEKPHWLTGVPCTVKESFGVQGCPNSSGHQYRRHVVSASDAPTVARLRAAGCVFLGLTNISEMCMWMESNNKVYGITCNPYDTRRLVGGSSGGEGAAVAACFSPFGLGGDVGGSIRMPAFFNGVYGYKASAHLIPNRGQHPGPRGQLNHLISTGPICRFAEDLLPLGRVLAEGGFLEDPVEYPPCPPLPKALHMNLTTIAGPRRKKEEETLDCSPLPRTLHMNLNTIPGAKKKLRVYAITDFGLFAVRVADAQKKAVMRVAEHLERQYGAELTVLNFRDPSQNRPIASKEQFPAGWEDFRMILPLWSAHMTHDKNERSFTDFMSEGSMEGPIRPYRELLRWVFGQSLHTAMSIALCAIEKTEELFNTSNLRKRNLARGLEFRAAIQRELGDDAVIICPTYPIPAPKHHEPTWIPVQWQYTAAFNLTQNPVINVPVWDDVPEMKAPSYEEARAAGRPADHHIPKGVQVVSRWGNDGLALSVAAALDRDGVGGYRLPSWAVDASTSI